MVIPISASGSPIQQNKKNSSNQSRSVVYAVKVDDTYQELVPTQEAFQKFLSRNEVFSRCRIVSCSIPEERFGFEVDVSRFSGLSEINREGLQSLLDQELHKLWKKDQLQKWRKGLRRCDTILPSRLFFMLGTI